MFKPVKDQKTEIIQKKLYNELKNEMENSKNILTIAKNSLPVLFVNYVLDDKNLFAA